jgi:membrane-associated phospholipid phosphatase
MAGAVGSSRLYLKAHSPKQIIAGFLLGIVLSWSAVTFFV